MSNEITTTDNNFQVFSGASAFEQAQRMATALSKSTLVPKEYQMNISNCLIALEAACRIKASPLQVMQNLYIVHGRPSWSSQFIISAVNTSGKFSPLRFKIEGEGDKRTCIAYALEKETGEVLESPPVSIDMAKKEGWYGKNGSKWQTMPELMLRYRAAAFFGRLYAPEILMGMRAVEEVEDVAEPIDVTPQPQQTPVESLNEKYLAPEPEANPFSPDAIPVPKTAEGAADWMGWAFKLEAQIKAAPDTENLKRLVKANEAPIRNMKRDANHLYEAFNTLFLTRSAGLSNA